MTDPHVQSYAERIAEALRKDDYPSRLTSAEAAMIRSRYLGGPADLGAPSTIRELSQEIASALA